MMYITPYIANIVYLRPMEMFKAQILAQYLRILSIHTRSSANTREYRILEYSWDTRKCYVINTRSNASIDFVMCTNTRIRE
jgi:hypothetical protein